MITIYQRHRQTDRRTDGQTDRQTTCDRNTALCTKVHRAEKHQIQLKNCSLSHCITLSVGSAPFSIPSMSFCSLSSWFTSSCAYHSHHLCPHHLSLPLPFTPDLKPIFFTNPFLQSILILIPSGLLSGILNLY